MRHHTSGLVSLVIVALALGLTAPPARAETVCLGLQPFDDVLTLDYTYLPALGIAVVAVAWDSESYHLEGGGVVTANHAGDGFLVDFTFANPSNFFALNPVGRLVGSLQAGTFTGPWAFDFLGNTESEPFLNGGTFAPVTCGGLGILRPMAQGRGLAGAGR